MAEWPRGIRGGGASSQNKAVSETCKCTILWESMLVLSSRLEFPAKAPVTKRRAGFGGDTNQTLRNRWQLVTGGRAGLDLPYLGEWDRPVGAAHLGTTTRGQSGDTGAGQEASL